MSYDVAPGVALIIALRLLVLLALLGAFDTLYYHEWRARLPALGVAARDELRLHALRDFVYAILFATIPWIAWQGFYVFALAALLLIEIILTLWDFVVEDWIRKPLGGVYPGERVMHAIMGIVYGAALAFLVPAMHEWWLLPARLVIVVPPSMRLGAILTLMAAGVLLSGIRDWLASTGMRGGAWPWTPP
ncbi:MAG TPA: hypothetical protein VHX36_00300 [Candidatus Acidoferrales bacterium]|jgi:hypothetical protein|nr:hypothetical protein [Candidatus Acidoferrales bacterium]